VRHNAPTTFDTKGDAEAWLGKEKWLITMDQWVSPAERLAALRPKPKPTFGPYATSWVQRRGLKPKTMEGYEHLLAKYLLPAFAETELTNITPAGVRDWWDGLDRTTPTVNARAYALLKTIFNSAIADDFTTTNPCRIRGASTTQRLRDVRPASVAELEIILATLPESRRVVAALCAWCALRIGEVLELRRKDVDVAQRIVKVRRAVSWVHGKSIVGTPKSAAGIRAVSVPPHVMPMIEEHLSERVGARADALLFPAADGVSHLQPSVFREPWVKARAAAGRSDLRVHDLRHTGATMAAMTGATLAELQERLGHSSVNAALRYQHAAQGRDAEIAAALSAMAAAQIPAPATIRESSRRPRL
jgi:integrase